MKAHLQKGLHIAGVVAPIVCLVHCLAMPIILSALPFLTAGHHPGEKDHDTWFHWLIVGMCALAILPQWRNHKKLTVPLLFTAGGAFVLLPAYFEAIEATVPSFVLSILASICLVSANLLNTRYAKAHAAAETACCGHSHKPAI